MLEDVPILLKKIRAMQPGEAPFAARSFYDSVAGLQVIFDC